MTDDRLTRNAARRAITIGRVRSGTPASILRPVKSGGTREYVTEVALGYDIIHDSEVDADLDTVFAAHNDLVTAFNSLPGAPPPVVIGPSAPASPVVGQLWWRTTDGNLYVYYNDGVTSQFVPAMASVGKLIGGQFYLLAGSLGGVPTAGLSVALYDAAMAFTLPAGLTGSQALAKGAATALTLFDVQVNGASKGKIQWAAGATVATFVWATSVAVGVGDRIEIIAATPADATLADPTWTLRGAL
jgi:hypothetical protein